MLGISIASWRCPRPAMWYKPMQRSVRSRLPLKHGNNHSNSFHCCCKPTAPCRVKRRERDIKLQELDELELAILEVINIPSSATMTRRCSMTGGAPDLDILGLINIPSPLLP